MVSRRIGFGVLLAALGALPGFAQDAVCIDPRTGGVDGTATQGFQQMRANADQRAMSAMVGVWYSELPNPFTSQVAYRYLTYEPGGSFVYNNRVCDTASGMCGDYQGFGLYAVRSQADGSMMTMTITSDLERDRVCNIATSRFIDANTIAEQGGSIWQRVR